MSFTTRNPTVPVLLKTKKPKVFLFFKCLNKAQYRRADDSKITWKKAHSDPVIKSHIDSLKSLLVDIQGNRCAYCDLPLQPNGNVRQIEHSLPSSEFKNLIFCLDNLSVACALCNGVKLTSIWTDLIPRTSKSLRVRNSVDHIDFYLPSHHVHEEHIISITIKINGFLVYIFKGRTDIGRKLCRDLLSKVAGKLMGGDDVLKARENLLLLQDSLDSSLRPTFEPLIDASLGVMRDL